MELEELKKNWNIMEERLGRLEMEQRQQKNKTVNSKLQQVRERILKRFIILLVVLPALFLIMGHHDNYVFSLLTWVLLFVFVAVIIARQFTWWLLLKRIDCLKLTVREICLAENRFHISFKAGIALSVACGIPLLVSMLWDMSEFGDPYMLIGAWTGLGIGLLAGLRLFFRAWRGVKELREAITDLQ